MKKILFTLAALICVFTAKSQCCGSQSSCCQQSCDSVPKTLIAFFSASGVTKNAANQLAEVINADLFEIIPEQPYTDADLNYRDKTSRSYVEMHDLSSRPAIKNKVENMDDYDIVLIGFPIWWNLPPTIINTFIESYDLSGKTVVPFATSGSSSIDNSQKELQKKYSTFHWMPGQLLNTINPEALKKWEANYKPKK